MKYEVFIDDSPEFLSKRIFITYKQDGKRWVAKTIELKFEPVDYSKQAEPTILIPDSEELLEAFAIALDKANVKLPEESYIAGKLGATEKHLEDMRNLVFNKPNQHNKGE
jgi:hypothetical protein